MHQGNAGLESGHRHGPNALERLEQALAAATVKLPKVLASGVVSEVGPSHCRINGLSQLVRLGEFVEDVLQHERARAVAVVATGDESPMMRRLAPKTAMCIAEYFRDAGKKVLLIIDSVTRFAHAARDVALAAGEPPVARGYPPSVLNDLPKL